MDEAIRKQLQQLPSVDQAVRSVGADGLPRWAVTEAVRQEIERVRRELVQGRAATFDPEMVQKVAEQLIRPPLRPLINATGVVLHTNLGRAPLGHDVVERIGEVAAGYSNLEYVVEERRRGSRHQHVAEILCRLCGAEDAVVVNNNAAAVLLTLAGLAHGREVVVSRGELIEIGGSFRLPDVMAASGAHLHEVGTTNRTHAKDYRAAINEQTALLLKAHRSNFAVVGFSKEVEPEEMVAIGHEHGILTAYDLGSGSLLDYGELGLPVTETTVQGAVRSGFDIVSFSGDKMLGGPQAGIIVGRADAVATLRSHPLMRPLRPDKMTLAGLQATLELYRDGVAKEQLPALQMISAPAEQLKRRADRLRRRLRRVLPAPWELKSVKVNSRVGGGAMPLAGLRSWAVQLHHLELSADGIEARLREGDPAVIGRIEEDRLLLDVRTVPEERHADLELAVKQRLGQESR